MTLELATRLKTGPCRYLFTGNGNRDMATGINENIEILGRVLHVQTELGRQDESVIRTTVYDGGRIVATREIAVDPDRGTEDEVLEQIRAHHALIVDNLITRSAELAAQRRVSSTAATATVDGITDDRGLMARARHPLPAGTDPSLRRALRTRRLVGPFSQRFSTVGSAQPGGEQALDAAEASVAWIMNSPAFRGLRIDEQVRFFDLRERLEWWRSGDLSVPDRSDLIDDIAAFARHLEAVSHRRELMEFDHRLLLWAIGCLAEDGSASDVCGQLEFLRGRDADLDRLLEEPDAVSDHDLLEQLMDLLDRTHPAE
jgi:hypothetical protein